MYKKIIVLVDYRGNFGSKYNAVPYNSGFDKGKFKESLNSFGYSVEFCPYWKVSLTQEFIANKIFIHDSIEDTNYKYKSYMEDIIYALEISNAIILPAFKKSAIL